MTEALVPKPHRGRVNIGSSARKKHGQAVQDQLKSILQDPIFRNSQRCVRFLQFVVDEALAGRNEEIKERTIGIKVLQKCHDWDSNNDHSVRSIAFEVRKRLSQYYSLLTHKSELRIELMPGSYVPQFKEPSPGPTPEACTTSLDRFWNIMLASTHQFRLIIGAPVKMDPFFDPAAVGHTIIKSSNKKSGAALSIFELHNSTQLVALYDATVLAQLACFLGGREKSWRIFYAPEARYEDIKRGPAILIGGFNNQWSLRLTKDLRFGLCIQKKSRCAIIDRQNPTRPAWAHNFGMPCNKLFEDYALILRLFDQTTGQFVLMISGMTRFGTLAAGEFVTNESYLCELEKLAPKGWEFRNLEIVLSAEIIEGINGPPRILDACFW
jgi:hypothetical protein